ncbi:hypothetical protein PLCT2_02301 [Planctomycetaceae bacterium]|nr:hypothetical protein PLCT2_02301 [Planctomycetaceae bacterium]
MAKVEGAIAGYGCSEKWRQDRDPILNEDSTQTHCSDGHIFCITGMAVRQTQRGKGLGLVILDYLIGIARRHECTRIILETTHAQGLYARRGFQVIREREQDGIQLSVMQLELTE